MYLSRLKMEKKDMYKQERIVIEDMNVGNKCTKITKHLTGGKSVLKLPFTVSFMDKGDYKIHIDSGKVIVEKIS